MKDVPFSREETMAAEERTRFYDTRIASIADFASRYSGEFKQRLVRAGVKAAHVKTTRDLESIPFISRDDVISMQAKKPPFGDLLAMPEDNLFKVLYSPGPMYIPVASPDYSRAVLRMLHSAGLRSGDTVICSLPSLFAAGATIEDALAVGKFVSIPAGAGNTELQVNIIRDLKVRGFAGTPSFLMNIVTKARELGYDFRRSNMKSAIVTAEPLLPAVRQTLEGEYGINVVSCLGVGTAVWLGFECSEKQGFHIVEEAFVEVVDPQTGKQLPPGETGALVVTGLINNAFPLIRYETGDLTALNAEPCPCGRTSYRLTGILGRIGDSVKVRALYLTPAQVKSVISRFPAVSRCQVVVDRVGYRDDMAFNLELADEPPDRERFCDDLQSCFQDSCRLRIDRINFVARGSIAEGAKLIVDDRHWEVKG